MPASASRARAPPHRGRASGRTRGSRRATPVPPRGQGAGGRSRLPCRPARTRASSARPERRSRATRGHWRPPESWRRRPSWSSARRPSCLPPRAHRSRVRGGHPTDRPLSRRASKRKPRRRSRRARRSCARTRRAPPRSLAPPGHADPSRRLRSSQRELLQRGLARAICWTSYSKLPAITMPPPFSRVSRVLESRVGTFAQIAAPEARFRAKAPDAAAGYFAARMISLARGPM